QCVIVKSMRVKPERFLLEPRNESCNHCANFSTLRSLTVFPLLISQRVIGMTGFVAQALLRTRHLTPPPFRRCLLCTSSARIRLPAMR
ncbi:hypothetical protein, partial [Serratia nevei]|uniref:hypothetical protein n=4 Tax=Serratia TaxID=613 RepID=UPI002AA0D11C